MGPFDAETWAPIPGLGGRYEISTMGSARTLPHVVVRSNGVPCRVRGGPLKVTVGPNGYGTVRILRSNKLVHELMATTFLGLRPPGHYVRHLDDVRTNNVLSNLAWGTPADNSADCVRNGHHVQANRTRCLRGHLLEPPNLKEWAWRRGRRQCVACMKGRSSARTLRGGSVQAESDRHYRRIMPDDVTRKAA